MKTPDQLDQEAFDNLRECWSAHKHRYARLCLSLAGLLMLVDALWNLFL